MQVDRSCVVSSAWFACLLLLFSTLSTRVTEVGGTHQSIPPSVVKLWASAFGGEMKSISAKYSGSQLLQKKYKEFERAVRVEEIDGLRLVKRLAEDMEEMFHKKAQAMKAGRRSGDGEASVCEGFTDVFIQFKSQKQEFIGSRIPDGSDT